MAFGDFLSSGTNSSTNPGTGISVSAGFTVSAGDLVFVLYAIDSSSNQSISISDGLGNTYTKINDDSPGTRTWLSAWYSVITTGGTCTPAASHNSNANDAAIVAARYEGPFAASPLDVDTTSATDNTSSFSCPATGTLAQADELVIACGSISGPQATFAATSPMGNIVQAASGTGSFTHAGCIASKVVSSTSTTTPAFTSASNPATAAAWYTASFKQGTVSGGGPLVGGGELLRSALLRGGRLVSAPANFDARRL